MNEIVKLVRGLTRPLITFMLVSSIIGLAFLGKEVPEPLKTMAASALGFWFAAHSLAKDG